MTLSRFSSLSVIFYMPYRPLRAYGGIKIYLKICLKICLKKKKDTFQEYALQHSEGRKIGVFGNIMAHSKRKLIEACCKIRQIIGISWYLAVSHGFAFLCKINILTL